MRVETLWQGERRVARMHWWRQVVNRPGGVQGEEIFDEALVQRFRFSTEDPRGAELNAVTLECWS